MSAAAPGTGKDHVDKRAHHAEQRLNDVTGVLGPSHPSPGSPCLVVVAGRGVELRAFSDADLSEVTTAFTDPEIARWNPGPSGDDQDQATAEWMRSRNDWSDGAHASWAIADPEGRAVGSLSLHHLDPAQGDGEVGYWIVPWARGRGFATSAVHLATLRLHRLYLYHAVDNTASCRVAAATGFRLEGKLRQSHRYGDGQFHDEHLHARLSSDPPR
jgi:RimJ/RimL family protein N-acetyltransferase